MVGKIPYVKKGGNMKKGKQKTKTPAVPFLREPVTLFFAKQERLRAEGVRRVLLCTDGEVCLRLRTGSLRVQGRDLVCTTFSCGAVEVIGAIEDIRIERRGEGENSLV